MRARGVPVEFKVAAQCGPRGYFARVELTVEVDADSGALRSKTPQVEFEASVEVRWRPAISFGIAYAVERVATPIAAVHVALLDVYLVDTSQVVVAFATASALLRRFGVEGTVLPSLDAAGGVFLFPK